MKHQYFGDQNDYVKYGLLRLLSARSGLRVGVAWMLTSGDDRPDGSRTAYWNQPEWRVHDPELYDRLAHLAGRPAARDVELFRRWDLVPGARDFDRALPEDPDARAAWMADARQSLADCPLLFFDPDNGLGVESVAPGDRGASRYLFWDEARAAWEAGHSLLVYQHFPRVDHDEFERELMERAGRRLAGASVVAFRSAHVLFLLAAQPGHAPALAAAADAVAERWGERLQLRREAVVGDRAEAIAAVCDALRADGPGAATEALARRWPHAPTPAAERAHSQRDALGVWMRDGFVDRYDGARLVFPGTLRLLSLRLPEALPYPPHGQVDETHPAYWEVHPTVDPMVPIARGGLDEPSNWVTTSQRNHVVKAHWTLAELRWTLRPPGTLEAWDGLAGWFRAMVAAEPALREHEPVDAWCRLLEQVRPTA